MYRIITRRWGVLLALVLVAAACEPVTTEPITALDMEPALSSHSASGASARGHIDIMVDENGTSISLQRYSFTASEGSDGVRGQFQAFLNPGTEFAARVHGEVTCMVVMDGSARLGGVITQSDPDFGEFDGEPLGMFWEVRDNGEGRGAQDAGTFMSIAPSFVVADFCEFGFGIPPLPSGRGNVQVTG
jgi:hypothetical protein